MRCLIFCRRQTLMLFNNVSSHCDLKCAVIVSKENKKTHRALNNDRNTVYQYKIDGEVIPQNNQSKRCDYLEPVDTILATWRCTRFERTTGR